MWRDAHSYLITMLRKVTSRIRPVSSLCHEWPLVIIYSCNKTFLQKNFRTLLAPHTRIDLKQTLSYGWRSHKWQKKISCHNRLSEEFRVSGGAPGAELNYSIDGNKTYTTGVTIVSAPGRLQVIAWLNLLLSKRWYPQQRARHTRALSILNVILHEYNSFLAPITFVRCEIRRQSPNMSPRCCESLHEMESVEWVCRQRIVGGRQQRGRREHVMNGADFKQKAENNTKNWLEVESIQKLKQYAIKQSFN